MDKIFDFLANNYIYFLIVSVILLVALIGLIASNKKKKGSAVEFAAPGSQPLDNPEPTIDNVPVSKEVSNIEVEETPVSTEPFVEPSLDGLASTATEVNINVPEENNNESMLIIEDKPLESTMFANSDEPTLVIEDKTIAPANIEQTEQPMLVIEDKPTPVESTMVVPEIPEVNQTVPVTNEVVTPEIPEVNQTVPVTNEVVTPEIPEVNQTVPVTNEVVSPEIPVVNQEVPVNNKSIFETPSTPEIPTTPTTSIFENTNN